MKNKNLIIKRIFPELQNNQYLKLKIDNKSINYISIKEHARIITNLILEKLNNMGIKNENLVITDATGGVGGNTISFGKAFSKVISVEIDTLRSLYLRNNIQLYDLDNVQIINEDYTKLNLDQDILFVDPPWGGSSYKEQQNIKLSLGNISIESICNNASYNTKLIVLKLPINYDINYLMKAIIFRKITVVNLKKMLIILIETNF